MKQQGGNAVYDVYGTVNHKGGEVNEGHYYAVIRNDEIIRGTGTKSEGKSGWSSYDDNNVTEVNEAAICTQDTYLIFLRSRNSLVPATNDDRTNRQKRSTLLLSPPRTVGSAVDATSPQVQHAKVKYSHLANCRNILLSINFISSYVHCLPEKTETRRN